MVQVQDLKLKDDVLPFFNFTNNRYAEEFLLHLLQKAPDTKAEVLERTVAVQGMLANWAVLENFTYRKLDLLEVHAFMGSIGKEGIQGRGNKFRTSLKLLLSETERTKQQSQLVQLILLLDGLRNRYLSRLDNTVFPEGFKKKLKGAQTFLTKLRLETNAELVREQRFGISEIVAFSDLLHSLDPQEVASFWLFFFAFEAYYSIAKAVCIHNFTFATFQEGSFYIADFYHPIIKQPVKNTITLVPEQNVLLLTGPNMSGKSTLLKAISLCVYLARAGFPVPAGKCTVPFFHSVAVAINLNDNLRDGYSHFMAELKHLKAVVNAARKGNQCFAVFDEIFRGTNVDDALEITRATINGLAARRNSYFMVSTHMLQLEEQLHPGNSDSIKKNYIECSLENGEPTFTYKLQCGWSQLKIGKILFEKEGLAELLAGR